MRKVFFANVGALCLLLLPTQLCDAAEEKKPSAASKTKAEGRNTISHQVPTQRDFAHKFVIDTKFDRFRDQTIISFRPPGLNLGGKLTLTAMFSFSGKEITEPLGANHLVNLGFASTSDTWKYLRNHYLILLVNGDRLDLGELDHHGSTGKGSVIEVMWAKIPAKTFLKIVNAKKVEGQLFTTEFTLSHDTMEALRDFASRMAPTKKPQGS